MIVDLPMYDWPGIRAETDAFWSAVAAGLEARGIASPAALARSGDIAATWGDPDLLLAQACGMPYVTGHCAGALIVARPDYGLAEARDGWYRSAIVARTEDVAGTGREAVLGFQGRRVALNEWGSYSGHIALRAYLAIPREGATEPFFGEAVLSGRHRDSARLVAEGAADLAALDGVSWALLRAHEPEIAGRLGVVDMTPPAPALPFITAPRNAPLRAALAAALDEAAAALPAVPGLPRAVMPADDADYQPIRQAARWAARERFAPEAPGVPPV